MVGANPPLFTFLSMRVYRKVVRVSVGMAESIPTTTRIRAVRVCEGLVGWKELFGPDPDSPGIPAVH
jgi:hypothetical protein